MKNVHATITVLAALLIVPAARAEIRTFAVTDWNNPNTCATTRHYGGGAFTHGVEFVTNLGAGATINSVKLTVNHGVNCTSTPNTWKLNGGASSANSYVHNACTCSTSGTVTRVLFFDPSTLVLAGNNQLGMGLTTGGGTTAGIQQLGGQWGEVEIDCDDCDGAGGGGGGGDCDLSGVEGQLDDIEDSLADIDADIVFVESKLDDETRFTSDAEAAALQASIISQVDQNETLINNLDADVAVIDGKLDDATRFTDDAEAAALEAALTAEIDTNEALILDLVLDVANVDSKIDLANTKIDALDLHLTQVETKIDNLELNLDAHFDGAMRRQIEDNLAHGICTNWMTSPDAGGHLDITMQVISDVVTRAEAMGCPTPSHLEKAKCALDLARGIVAQGWPMDCDRLCKALTTSYEFATKGNGVGGSLGACGDDDSN